jgi:anti-anti-sigma factor
MSEQSHPPAVTVLAPAGRLDAAVSPHLRREIGEHLAQGNIYIIVNLANVNYMSSSALRALLIGHKRAMEAGGNLILCDIQPQVLRVVKMVGFDQVFPIFTSEVAALQAITAIPAAGEAGS